jgi:type IV pilus assembly protein PilY1
MNARILLSWSAALALNALAPMTHAAVILDLADQPLNAAPTVAGNVALDLSVEFPTAISVAHLDTVYTSASTYLGYFDPNKCYVYTFVEVETSTNKTHFAPAAVAKDHLCKDEGAAKDVDHMWSGNYMNWATTQTIDPFRWAMTGGYRVVDTPSLTLLEKAWASGQGGTNNFPDKVVSLATDIAAATPFVGSGNLTAYVQGRHEYVNFVADGAVGTGGFLATYFNGTNLDYDSPAARPVLTRTESINFNWGLGSPKPGPVNSDNFSVRWVALQTVAAGGTYSFRTSSEGGVRLWVNGQPLINNWTAHTLFDNEGVITLGKDQAMNIRVEYFNKTGSATMKLAWKRPGDRVYSTYTAGDYWYAPIRVKVCDPNAPGGLEKNCVAYANDQFKPEGLMQNYANKIRYSVFGYLNDSNRLRDGAVLRAAQKFVGPTYPKVGSAATPNPQAEWDADTGVFFSNPDAANAAATTKDFGTSIVNSGAINYVNKFGEIIPGDYKSYDPVSELYYASLRYFKKQGNVDSWSSSQGGSTDQKKTWADGFPVITSWSDPIQYTCQKNYILGIGDVHSHADKNVPGPTGTLYEPTKPLGADGLMEDSTYSKAINAVTATNKVGELQGLGNTLGTAVTVGSCCGGNSYLMGGLAYDAHTRDIRPDLAGMQTVQTYWLDVLEYQKFEKNNMFYLAAKYGGFTVPNGFDPYSRTTPLDEKWWHTSADKVGTGTEEQPRPDNYFTGGRPDQMVEGLKAAFAKIVDNLSEAKSAVSVPSTPNLDVKGASYGSKYTAKGWTGTVTGALSLYNEATGEISLTPDKWNAGTLLDAKAPSARKIVTCCTAADGKALSLPFTAASLSGNNLSSRTLYTSFANVPGVPPASQSASNFLNYLRGDRSLERDPNNANGVYRKREHLLGDIVDSKILPVGAPESSYFDSSNPGYSAFKKLYRERKTVVYAGANDGMLHAFDGYIPTDSEANTGGSELFGFIPSFMYGTAASAGSTGLAALGNPSYQHSYRVNGVLKQADVNFNQTYGVTGSGAAQTDGDWHTVLVGGLGKGGKGYFALDITDPSNWTGSTPAIAEAAVAKKVLWEFPASPELASDSKNLLATSAKAASTMGYSYGEPQIAKTAKYGWVVLLPSGYNNADGKGYLFLVDIRSGALLETLVTPEGSVNAPINLANIVAHIPDDTSFLVEAVYGADMRGNVWRFDLRGTGNYAAPTKIATLTDAKSNPQSVTAPIRVAIDSSSSNKRYILIGTGRLLSDSDAGSTDTQTFYVLLDGDAKNFFTSTTLPSNFKFPLGRVDLQQATNLDAGVENATMGWYLDLKLPGDAVDDIAYRVNLAPLFVNGLAYVRAIQPSADPCSPDGKGRALDLDIGTGKVWSRQDSDSPYIDLSYISINGQKKIVSTTAKGTIKSDDAPPGKPVRSGRLSWREAPTAE